MHPDDTTINLQVKAVWPSDTGSEVEFVNQLAVAYDGNGFYLSVGHATVGVLPQDQLEANQEIEMAVTPKGTFFLTENNMRQLHALLTQQVMNLDYRAGTDG